jgi:hypothetical protein
MSAQEENTRIKENESLRKQIETLEEENKRLKEEIVGKQMHLRRVQDYFKYEIVHYFAKSYSLRDTTAQFGFENVCDCYDALTVFCGCPGPVQAADDYMECYKEIFGWEYEEETDATSECSLSNYSGSDSE